MGGRPAAGEEHQRLFIAVPVAEAVRERIAEAVSAAREAGPAGQAGHGRVRWVSTAGLHLTLKFLGSTDPGRLAAVREIVADTAVEARPAELGLRGVGAFPSAGRPRVLWMGLVHGDIEQSFDVQAIRIKHANRFQERLDDRGIPVEQLRFESAKHITGYHGPQ